MLTKEQAISGQVFHYGDCAEKLEVWRRNGQTQVWKTRPTHFSVPVKHGLYSYGRLTHTQAPFFHLEEDCPLRQ